MAEKKKKTVLHLIPATKKPVRKKRFPAKAVGEKAAKDFKNEPDVKSTKRLQENTKKVQEAYQKIKPSSRKAITKNQRERTGKELSKKINKRMADRTGV